MISELQLVETIPFNNTKIGFIDHLLQTQDFCFSSSKFSYLSLVSSQCILFWLSGLLHSVTVFLTVDICYFCQYFLYSKHFKFKLILLNLKNRSTHYNVFCIIQFKNMSEQMVIGQCSFWLSFPRENNKFSSENHKIQGCWNWLDFNGTDLSLP